jgi:Replication initiator protein, pSAM2
MTDLKVPGLGLLRELEDAAGKCRRPVGVTGRLAECDPVTGEVIRIVDTTQLPGGRIEVPCGNRREQVCPPCSRLCKGDTFQVMIAGLRGGHGIPEDVARHPAVFVTLTAPGFGLVHRGPGLDGQLVQCRPRRDRPVCEHGQPASCGRRHQDGEPGIGQPLCMECFDYQGSVLFNASVPALWDQAVQAVRRQLAADTGLSQRALRCHVRLSFGKVAEYQERGLVHVHAVFRLDGPDGPGDPAPPWASADLLRTAVLAAAQHPCRDAAPP